MSPSEGGPGENDVVLGVYSTRANSFSLVGLPKENGAVVVERQKPNQIFKKSNVEKKWINERRKKKGP